MVTSSRTARRLHIIARPNCSSSWANNQRLLLALSIPSLGAAIAFALLGAWPILPIAGLEMLALGTALYYTSWRAQYRQVITLGRHAIRIDKGFYRPRQSFLLRRAHSALDILTRDHPLDRPELALHDRHQQVGVGEFLNRDDSLELARLLRSEIKVSSDGAPGSALL
jgi:uncharacterized membrane protein